MSDNLLANLFAAACGVPSITGIGENLKKKCKRKQEAVEIDMADKIMLSGCQTTLGLGTRLSSRAHMPQVKLSTRGCFYHASRWR